MSRIKKVFITGASGGIGSAICDKFYNQNFTLVLTSSSNTKLENLKKKYGSTHFYYKIDLSDNKNLQNSLDEISKIHKDLSVIVNNAGVTQDNLILE